MIFTGASFQFPFVVDFILKGYTFFTNHQLNSIFRLAGFSCCGEVLGLTGFLLLLKRFIFARPEKQNEQLFIKFVYVCLFLFFFYHILTDSINVPIWDDYQYILKFGNMFSVTTDFSVRANLVFEPFYESRIIILKGLCACILLTGASVNFQYLILLISILYFMVFVLYYKSVIIPPSEKLSLLLPAALIMFQFQTYDCLFWVSAGFDFVVTFIASFMAAIFIQKGRPIHMLTGCACILLAIFTYANGWIIWAILTVYLFRSKPGLHSWLLLSTGLILFFWYFKWPLKSPESAGVPVSWYIYPAYYFAFCGSAFRFFNSVPLSISAGLVLHIGLFYLYSKRYFKSNQVVACMLLFILGSAAATAFFRTEDGGLSQALSPRYGFYSQMLFVFVMTGFIQVHQDKIKGMLYAWILFLSVMWQLLSAFMFYPEVVMRKRVLEAYIRPWKEQSDIPVNLQSYETNPWIFGASPIDDISRACKLGVYEP